MPSIFIFEFVTSGGLRSMGASLEDSFVREGAAMAAALAGDFARLPGTSVVLLRDEMLAADSRWLDLKGDEGAERISTVPTASAAEVEAQFDSWANRCDATVVIAPELDGILLDWVYRAEEAGARLLSPHSGFVELAADKHATAERLCQHGVSAPSGVALEAGDPLPPDFVFPAVLKPRDGAGSLGVAYLHEHPKEKLVVDRPSRCERFVPGSPASVAVLYGSGDAYRILPACTQRLSQDFRYLGGRLPLPQELALRAHRLVDRAVATLPTTVGYVGFDLILGNAPDGSGDAIIEVNPRLTTSYVGLRAFCRQNLAGVMIALASGARPGLSFRPNPLEFDAMGGIFT